MMKERKNKGKKGAFSASPFTRLKGLRGTVPAASVPEGTPCPAPVQGEEADGDELFLRAMRGVERVDAPAESLRAAAVPQHQPRRVEEEERQVFLQAVAAFRMDVTFSDDFPEDDEMRPLPVNRMRQLRRGKIRVDYELDLHGLCREEALKSVSAFIAGAYRRGQKTVLVITGKGNNSPGEPVLLKAVTDWLREKASGTVAEFFPAPREMGGAGAIVVFLKEK